MPGTDDKLPPATWRIADATDLAKLRWATHIMGQLDVPWNQAGLYSRALHDLRSAAHRIESNDLRPVAAAMVERMRAERDALRTALDFAAGAIGDAIYTEDGLDGDAGQRVLHIITEARERGTFDGAAYGSLDHLCPFERAEKLAAERDALAKDAAQYRSLRTATLRWWFAARDAACDMPKEELDAWRSVGDALGGDAIDAAMEPGDETREQQR